jgi:hypothetical protein
VLLKVNFSPATTWVAAIVDGVTFINGKAVQQVRQSWGAVKTGDQKLRQLAYLKLHPLVLCLTLSDEPA